MKGQRGFTLIEVLLAATLMTIIIGAGFSLHWAGVKAWNLGDNRIEVQQNVRIVMDSLDRNIRRSYKTTVNISGSNVLINIFQEDKEILYKLDKTNGQFGTGPTNNPIANFISDIKMLNSSGDIIVEVNSGERATIIVTGTKNGFTFTQEFLVSPRGIKKEGS
jgi:prepilin-type N-terminal cleavage/methylation domain-containing protein